MDAKDDQRDGAPLPDRIPSIEDWVGAMWEEATLRDTILVVESHDELRAALVARLAEEFFRVLEAATGAEAIRQARENQPDLVLLDLSLENESGFDVAEQLRIHPATRRIPIVGITTEKLHQRRAVELGLGPVLLMPLSLTDLITTIDGVMEQPEDIGSRPVELGTAQLRLELRDEIHSEHLTLGTYVPIRVMFEALPHNERHIDEFEERLERLGTAYEVHLEGQNIVLSLHASIVEAFAIGLNRDAPDELFFALLDAYPALNRDPEAVRRRLRLLEMDYGRLQRIAS
jgi:CheY-like chemotaxis protein